MNPEAHRDLQVLEALAENDCITQRRLSVRLGIALGLTNLYLKRLVRKGWVRCVTVRSNRFRYLLTPNGLAEKTRLTYEFMDYSLQLYRQVRIHLRERIQALDGRGSMRVAIYGTGEAAELAYLCLREMGLEPAAILDDRGGTTFLGLRVADVRIHPLGDYDAIVLATLDPDAAMLACLTARGVPASRIVTVREDTCVSSS
jgi:DNA-binding MarR family transcriptional regulator